MWSLSDEKEVYGQAVFTQGGYFEQDESSIIETLIDYETASEPDHFQSVGSRDTPYPVIVKTAVYSEDMIQGVHLWIMVMKSPCSTVISAWVRGWCWNRSQGMLPYASQPGEGMADLPLAIQSGCRSGRKSCKWNWMETLSFPEMASSEMETGVDPLTGSR